MATLPRTELALTEALANEQRRIYGVHDGGELQAGGTGVFIGERPFDPTRDDVSKVNPLSPWEMILGEPHVTLTIPERPVNVRVVTHERKQPEEDALGIIPAKRRLAAELAETIFEAMPGMTDRVFQYAVGEAADTVKDPEIDVIETGGTPEEDARAIAELCERGLTFVLSDFLRLPIEGEGDENLFASTVAVKTNHPFDIALPANVGRLASGYRGGEINTDNPEELQEVNGLMGKMHSETVERLAKAGLSVAHVIIEPGSNLGFEPQATDEALAQAIASQNEQ